MKHKPFNDADHNDVLETVKRLVSNHTIAQPQKHMDHMSGSGSAQILSTSAVDHRLILTPSLRVSSQGEQSEDMQLSHTSQQEPAMIDDTFHDEPKNPFAARTSVTSDVIKVTETSHDEPSAPDDVDNEQNVSQTIAPCDLPEQHTHLYKDIDGFSPPEDDPNLDEQLGDFLTNEDILADIGLNDDELRIMIKDVIREELRGEIGERVTRNIRKLVRQEIARTLSSLDFGS